MAAPSRRTRETAQLVLAALSDISDAKGASMESICDYIAKEYSVPDKNIESYVNNAFEKGVAFGAIKKCRGRFTIGEALDKIREHWRRRTRSKGKLRRKRRRHHD